jgi:trans-aconitate 2-methyltransferase
LPSLPWSPETYHRHAGPRLRPALDLLARVPLDRAAARRVVDLGCGGGALFPALRARFPDARLVGVDLSPAMLAKARENDPAVELVEADAAAWRPAEPVDLIVANASLHWLPDHERLMPDLLRRCRVLAVQVPDNFAEPSHRLVRELLAERSADAALGDHVLPAARYRALSRAVGAGTDIWQTTYFHELTGPDPVLEWLRGTTLLPVAAALGPDMPGFEAELGARLRAAYPPSADGTTLFPFRRLFLVATAAAAQPATAASPR